MQDLITDQERSRLLLTDDGIHLRDSVLWFDSYSNGKLSFLSSAALNARSFQFQVIATEETIRILETFNRRPKALICQYNRPFSVGRLSLELIPNGTILGGASLYVETPEASFLYAPFLQGERTGQLRHQQARKADNLILGAPSPLPLVGVSKRKKEKKRLLEFLQENRSRESRQVLFCQSSTVAPELTEFLTSHSIPVLVHGSIYKINKIYEQYGCNLGKYSVLSARNMNRKGHITLLPLTASIRRKFSCDDESVFAQDPCSYHLNFNEPLVSFEINSKPDLKTLENFVAQVEPREIFFFGPYAKQYAETLKLPAERVRALDNQQPTLF